MSSPASLHVVTAPVLLTPVPPPCGVLQVHTGPTKHPDPSAAVPQVTVLDMELTLLTVTAWLLGSGSLRDHEES